MSYIITPPRERRPFWRALSGSVNELIHTLSAATGVVVAVVGGLYVFDEAQDRTEARVTCAWQLLQSTKGATEDEGPIQALEALHAIGADIRRVGMEDRFLSGLELPNANLGQSNFARANLIEADLTGAVLTGANLTRANLSASSLIEADLGLADLREANLRKSDLSGSKLTGADLRGAKGLLADQITAACVQDEAEQPRLPVYLTHIRLSVCK